MPELNISPEELASSLQNGTPLQVLDVRAPEHVAHGRIDVPPEVSFLNIPGSQVRSMSSLKQTILDPNIPVVTVCGQGNDSFHVAAHLHTLGASARSLKGGMAAWMKLCVPKEISPPASLDTLLQFDRIGKASLGYVLISDGKAMIIDPPRNPSLYLKAVHDRGANLLAVADTHIHADYISGAPAIARDYDIPYYLHPADAVYPYDGTAGKIRYTPVDDGQVIRIGRADLHVMHTPGHTEGSVTFLVGQDLALTGDFLFVASIGRPDLAGKTAEWSTDLWKSLQRVRIEIERRCLILPAHYGEHSERNEDWSVSRQFDALLGQNSVFRMEREEEFQTWVAGKQTSFPDAYKTIKSINVGLTEVSPEEAEVLEAGKNECALG